jgi:hypothetical protein
MNTFHTIRFPDLFMQFLRFMSLYGIGLCTHILKFAGLPALFATYLLTFPAKPLNEPTIIVEAGFSLDGHILLFAGIFIFSVLSAILTIQTSTIYGQYSIENRESPTQEVMSHNMLETIPKTIGAFFLLSFAISIGLIFCIFPGIYILSAGVLLFPFIQDRQISIFAGLQLSVKLLRNHALKPIAFILLISIITSIPSTALGFLSDIPIPLIDTYMPRIITMIHSLISILALGMISVFGVILHKELLKGTDFATRIAPIK